MSLASGLRQRPELKSVMALATGNTLTQGINLLAYPLIAALSGPAAFGIFSQIISTAAIATLLLTFNMHGVLPTIFSRSRALRLAYVFLYFSFAFFIIMLTLIFLYFYFISDFIHQNQVTFSDAIFVVTVGFSSAVSSLGRMALAIFSKFSHVARSMNLRAFSFLTLAFPALYFFPSLERSNVLVVSFIVAEITSALYCFLKIPRSFKRNLGYFRITHFRKEVALRWPLLSTGLLSHSFLQIATSVPILAIGASFGPTAAGLYALSKRVSSVPTTVIASAISLVLSMNLSRTLKDDAAMFNRRLRNIMLTLGSVAIPGMACLALAYAFALQYLLPSEWALSWDVFLILLPACWITFITQCVGFLPLLTRSKWFLLAWSSTRAILTGTLLLTASRFHSLLAFVTALALVDIVSYTYFALYFLLNRFDYKT
jgi:O-antigen/teichoic acid export membrane protein